METDRRPGLITYDGLPISSGGGHGLGKRDRTAVWRAVSNFLVTHTTAQVPGEVYLTLGEGPEVDSTFFCHAHAAVSDALGQGERRQLVQGEVVEYEHGWRLGSSQIEDALTLMTSLEPFPEHWLGGPLVLAIRGPFRLRDPDTEQAFPFQDPEQYGGQEAAPGLPLGLSGLNVRLGSRSTCGIFLSLPFPDVTPEVSGYARRLDDALPFRLSEKHWSRWQLNQQGTRYYSRHVSVL